MEDIKKVKITYDNNNNNDYHHHRVVNLGTIGLNRTMFEVQVVDGSTIVVNNDELVDAAELAHQRRIQVRLDPADEILRAHQLCLRRF